MAGKPSPHAKRSGPRRSFYVSIQFQIFLVFTLVITLAFGSLYQRLKELATQHAMDHLAAELKTIVEITAAGIDGDMHQALVESDIPRGRPLEDERYRKIVEWLALVRESGGTATLPDGTEEHRVFPYTCVAAEEPGMIAFVGSAGAILPEPAGAEFRELDELLSQVMKDGFVQTSVQLDPFIIDDWGTWVTGTSPIYDSRGKVVGVVGIDIRDTTVIALQDRVTEIFLPAYIVTYIVTLLILLWLSYHVGRPIITLTRSAERVAGGDYGEGVTPQIRRFMRNEITALADVFNLMVDKIRQRETALSFSEARYRALVDSLPGPAFLSDLSGAMQLVSPQIESLLGYSPAEWSSDDGRFWTHLIHPDHRESIEAMIQAPEESPGTRSLEARILHKDGTYRWIEGRFCRFLEPDGKSLTVGIILDIQDRRQDQAQREAQNEELRVAYQELQRAQEQLIRSAKLVSVGELATGIAHEINNPLTAIRGLAQVLMSKLTKDDAQYEPINQIIVNTGRINKIVAHLRGFAVQTSTEQISVNLNDILEGALTLLNTQFVRQQIELALECEPNLPPVSGVPNQLEQAVINLLTNARDAILEKRVSGQITLKSWHDPVDHHVCLSVTDNGIGILPEHRSDIFAPFFTTKPPELGTGLGLSISHQIVQEHDGHILVDSQPGLGSTFTIVLPERKDPL